MDTLTTSPPEQINLILTDSYRFVSSQFPEAIGVTANNRRVAEVRHYPLSDGYIVIKDNRSQVEFIPFGSTHNVYIPMISANIKLGTNQATLLSRNNVAMLEQLPEPIISGPFSPEFEDLNIPEYLSKFVLKDGSVERFRHMKRTVYNAALKRYLNSNSNSNNLSPSDAKALKTEISQLELDYLNKIVENSKSKEQRKAIATKYALDNIFDEIARGSVELALMDDAQ